MNFKLNITDLKKPENVKKLMDALSEISEKVDVSVVTTAPNGSTEARKGKIVLYDNSGVFQIWINTDGSTTWTRIDADAVSPFVLQVKVGSFTRDLTTASGSQAVTGVGFQPTAVQFLFGVDGGVSQFSWGQTDGTTDNGYFDDTALGTSDKYALVGAKLAVLQQSGSDLQEAALSSLDSDGFTLDWTKTGSPTGTATILYFAIL